jgi:D-alanine-D-alanine ligase-like ATP-grasp enzyme
VFEAFQETDDVVVVDSVGDAEPAHLEWSRQRDTDWIEVTVGVLGRRGAMRALSPSLTIARKGVLSVEEKFMGGTGVNITPPPPPPLGRVAPDAAARTRSLVSLAADRLGIDGYARIDAFMHRDTGDVVVIEANSLPGLTPSTVLYHQALAEEPPIYPRELLERIIELGFEARSDPAG